MSLRVNKISQIECTTLFPNAVSLRMNIKQTLNTVSAYKRNAHKIYVEVQKKTKKQKKFHSHFGAVAKITETGGLLQN